MEEDKAYAMKLMHANQHLEELLFDLDDNIAKLIKHITTSAVSFQALFRNMQMKN